MLLPELHERELTGSKHFYMHNSGYSYFSGIHWMECKIPYSLLCHSLLLWSVPTLLHPLVGIVQMLINEQSISIKKVSTHLKKYLFVETVQWCKENRSICILHLSSMQFPLFSFYLTAHAIIISMKLRALLYEWVRETEWHGTQKYIVKKFFS